MRVRVESRGEGGGGAWRQMEVIFLLPARGWKYINAVARGLMDLLRRYMSLTESYHFQSVKRSFDEQRVGGKPYTPGNDPFLSRKTLRSLECFEEEIEIDDEERIQTWLATDTFSLGESINPKDAVVQKATMSVVFPDTEMRMIDVICDWCEKVAYVPAFDNNGKSNGSYGCDDCSIERLNGEMICTYTTVREALLDNNKCVNLKAGSVNKRSMEPCDDEHFNKEFIRCMSCDERMCMPIGTIECCSFNPCLSSGMMWSAALARLCRNCVMSGCPDEMHDGNWRKWLTYDRAHRLMLVYRSSLRRRLEREWGAQLARALAYNPGRDLMDEMEDIMDEETEEDADFEISSMEEEDWDAEARLVRGELTEAERAAWEGRQWVRLHAKRALDRRMAPIYNGMRRLNEAENGSK